MLRGASVTMEPTTAEPRTGAMIESGAGFPTRRMRRLRRSEGLRAIARETELTMADFMYPMFVAPGADVQHEINSMPGNYHWSIDRLPAEIERLAKLGVRAVILFGLPEHKDPIGSEAWSAHAPVQRAVRAIKATAPHLVVATDVCLCEYTSHGHCGVVHGETVHNDETLPLLARAALSHAEAGADMVAPSDMMDGRIGAIRAALDGAGFVDTAIMAYSAKYASGFYGPFREAADSAPQFGDRRAYQMDPPNVREALTEVELDIAEGADIVMVKPALAYLDVVRRVREATHLPVAAYNVSGEFAMVKAAARNGWIDERRVTMEILTGIKRAGANLILSYHAPDVAGWLREEA